MLTVILLVVLGGGAGLLAVSLVDSRGLSRLVGRLERPSLRAHRPRHTTAGPAAERHTGTATTTDEPDDEPVVVEAEVLETGPVGEVVAVAAPLATPANGSVGQRRGQRTLALDAVTSPPRARRADRSVPAAYTAVEGTYREVARPSVLRRLASLALLLVLVVGLGVAVAAVAGAVIGTGAEMLDRTIG